MMERNQTQMKQTKWRHSKTWLEFNEIINAERCTSEWGDEFTGCTPTKESSKGHPAYACCQHTEAKEMQQKQSECSTKFSSEEKNRKRQARDKERKKGGSNKSTKAQSWRLNRCTTPECQVELHQRLPAFKLSVCSILDWTNKTKYFLDCTQSSLVFQASKPERKSELRAA